jgi:hypothetical protein
MVGALARTAAFAPEFPDEMAQQAITAAHEVELRLTAATPRHRRFARLWLPRPGAGRKMREVVRGPAGARPEGGALAQG